MEVNLEEKREYLKKYRVNRAKILRIKEMILDFPENKEEYTSKLNCTRILKDKIEDEIEAVDGGILSEILSQKYICGKSMEQIGYSVNYSKRQVERLHLKALEKFKIT